MLQSSKDIFLQVLNIIGYSDNKEEFASKFFQLCEQQTIINLIKSLPQDKQTALQAELSKQTNPQLNNLLLKKYFSNEQVASSLEQATKQTFENYLQTIIPTLSGEQKVKLQSYLKSSFEKYFPPA